MRIKDFYNLSEIMNAIGLCAKKCRSLYRKSLDQIKTVATGNLSATFGRISQNQFDLVHNPIGPVRCIFS